MDYLKPLVPNINDIRSVFATG
jgi:hypothetical protein